MKKSNKLLLTILAVVIIFIFVVNLVLKYQMDNRVKSEPKVEVTATDSLSASASDSVAMEKAIDNQ